MAKNKNYKQTKRGGGGKHVAIYEDMQRTEAWKTLKPSIRALYVELKRRYNGSNNGIIILSHRDAGRALNVSHNTVGKWFKELERRGFIVCVRRHHLGPSGVGQTSHWRLTEVPSMDRKPATLEYKSWNEKKTKSPLKNVYTLY